MKIRILIIIIVIATTGLSCDTYSDQAKKRAEKAANATGEILIGIVDSSGNSSLFTEGVKMAIEEINMEGGILGRPIKAIFYDDENSVDKGNQIAKELSKNTDVIAVIGHLDTSVAISVSVTYEENGVLFIAPATTEQDLIRGGSRFTFRNIPYDETVGKEIADFVHRNGYNKIAIIFDSESTGKRLAGIFHKYASDKGVNIIAEKSYTEWDKDSRLMIADLMKGESFDAIFLGGILPAAADMIKQIRSMGVNVPIIGSEQLDSPELWNIAGKAAEGTIISTVFDAKQPRTNTRNFVKHFNEKLGFEPDTWAAQGYEAIKLLAYAIEKGDSSVPIIISTTLRFLEDWQGLTDTYSFQRDGNITGKRIFFKAVKEGKFEFLERGLREELNPFEVLEDITLRIPVAGEIFTIDPGKIDDMVSIDVVEQLFLGLTDFDPKTYEPVPELATKWKASEDGMTYVFEMRKDAVWTDGTPVTAHDLVWAVQRNLKPETQSPYAYVMYILKNAAAVNKGEIKDLSEIGVKAVDDFTVEFQLEYPAVYFPAMAGLWVYRPLPRKAVFLYGEQWTETKNIQSNGSYQLALWEKNMVMILRKNPIYYDAEKVSIPEVRYYTIPESSVGFGMYRNNQIDILGGAYLLIPPNEISDIIMNPELSSQFFQGTSFCTQAYIFNTRRPPMDNPLVRKAIASAIDRKMLIEMVAKGQEPATTFTRPPAFGAVDISEKVGIRFDPVRAKEWLAQAGYPDGKGFPEITLMYSESQVHENNAKAVQMFLKHNLNINIKLEERKFDDYLATRRKPDAPHMSRLGWCGDYPDANNFLNELFHPTDSENSIGWDSWEFANLMDTAREEEDTEIRKALYKRAEQILCEEECAVVPIYYEQYQYLIKPRVKNWYNMAIGGQHIRNWKLEE